MRRIIPLIFFAFVLLSIFFVTKSFYPVSTKTEQLVLGGKVFTVEIADTAPLREKGLSGHLPLLENQGMLFVFDTSGDYGFWMKDMTFPIDIIWLDSDTHITHIESSVWPYSYPTVYHSSIPSRYVLELSAGQAESLNLKIGDSAKITSI